MYITGMNSVMKGVDSNIKETTLTGWMRDIEEAFPYYKHTNPYAMAIAKYLVQTNADKFDAERALEIVRRTNFNYYGTKKIDDIVIDVARYYERLSSRSSRL